MTDFNPEYQSSFYQIGSIEDQMAREDLDRTLLAFGYISKAEEISRQIESSQPKLDPNVFYFNPATSAVVLVHLGIKAYKERRAMQFFERGQLILNEIDHRPAE